MRNDGDLDRMLTAVLDMRRRSFMQLKSLLRTRNYPPVIIRGSKGWLSAGAARPRLDPKTRENPRAAAVHHAVWQLLTPTYWPSRGVGRTPLLTRTNAATTARSLIWSADEGATGRRQLAHAELAGSKGPFRYASSLHDNAGCRRPWPAPALRENVGCCEPQA